MKKTMRCVLTITLVLTLSMLLASAASAASYAWNDSTGQHYVAVYDTKVEYIEYPIYGSALQPHTYGKESTVFFTGTVDKTQTYSVTGGPFPYATYVYQMMDQEGMLQSYTAYDVKSGYAISIPAEYSSGDYVPSIQFQVKSARWLVSNDIYLVDGDGAAPAIAPTPDTGSGTITDAPTGVWYFSAVRYY